MTRDQLIAETRRLVEEGERIRLRPSLAALRTWIAMSDELLRTAWGDMDRYHLSWLMVGRPRDAVRGRSMTEAEESAYVREVAEAKVAALRMSLRAVEEDRMPFLGALLVFLSGYLGLAVGFAPYTVPYVLDYRQTAAPDNALALMLVGAAVALPLILGYTAWVYWVFRGKVTPETGYH